MCNHEKRVVNGVFSLVLIFALGVPALSQRLVTVPVGTVVPLRIDTALSSNSSRVGDRFTATVFQSVIVDGRAVLPERAKVEGHVTGISPGERGRRPGTIAVAFDRIVLTNGTSIPIEATLTALSEEGRRKIEQDIRYQDRVDSGARNPRPIVFLAVAGGGGTTIGVAGSSAESTTVGAILGTLFSNGDRAEVQPGAEFGMMVERSFNVDADLFMRADDRGFDDRNIEPPTQNVLS